MNGAPDHPDPGTLLVGVSNPATADQLVRLSAVLTAARPLQLLLTHVVSVAEQISLTTGRSSPEVVRARDFLQTVTDGAVAAGIDTGGVVEVARNVHEGLLSAAESHRAEMILVGYSDEGGEGEVGEEEEWFDRTMHRVARKARADVVVAKFRTEAMGRVLVPVTEDSPLRVAGFLSRALAGVEDAELTFFHVVGSGQDPKEARHRVEARLEERGVASLGPLHVVESDSLEERIVEEAEGYDVVVLGPSGRPGFMEAIFSSRARRVAEDAPATVLLAWGRAGGGGATSRS